MSNESMMSSFTEPTLVLSDNSMNNDMPEAMEIDDDERGRISNYLLLELKGKGGFGEVWKALNIITDKIVALKIIHVSDPKIARMVLDEVKVLREISIPECHPFLACFYSYQYDEENKKVLIEMEYIEGEELQKWSKKLPTDILHNDLVLLLHDMVEALRYLHSKNVIHRDIKPSNILIREDYVPKLVDFGLGCNPELCNTKLCCHGGGGTPQFMAPETIQFQRNYFVSDIWSLGVTLFYIATGQYPFDFSLAKNSIEIQYIILNTEPKELRTYNFKLNRIVNGCLIKDLDRRFTLDDIFRELNY